MTGFCANFTLFVCCFWSSIFFWSSFVSNSRISCASTMSGSILLLDVTSSNWMPFDSSHSTSLCFTLFQFWSVFFVVNFCHVVNVWVNYWSFWTNLTVCFLWNLHMEMYLLDVCIFKSGLGVWMLFVGFGCFGF